MATRLTIAVGQSIIIKDGLEELKIIYEGTINQINPISGTTLDEVRCDLPLRLEVG